MYHDIPPESKSGPPNHRTGYFVRFHATTASQTTRTNELSKEPNDFGRGIMVAYIDDTTVKISDDMS